MRAAQFIIQQLFKEKKVTLRQIGHFYLEASAEGVTLTAEEGDFTGLISFVQDTRAAEDEALVSYIMQQTGKIRPLAIGDLESYLELVKQFLNLGKPFIIEGLGVLKKNQFGEVMFQPGEMAVTERVDTNLAKDSLKERRSADISFASVAKRKSWLSSRQLLTGGIILAVAALLFFLFSGHDDNSPTTAIKTVPPVADTAVQVNEQAIPPQIRQTTEDTLSNSNADSSPSFYVVLKQYNTLSKANFFYNKLKKDHPDLAVITRDSISYKVVVNMFTPLSDTVRASDSLYLMLGLPTYYELH
jgi:hypothetical protein